MGSASNNTTQPMTSQENRKWEEDAAKDLQKLIEQQEKSPQRPGSAKLKPPTTESSDTESPDMESPDTKSPDFLYLIPSNETAKLAFSELLDQKKAEKLSPHHFQYMVDTGRGPLRKAINYQARSKSETPDVEDSEEPKTSDINLGYFKVSFDYENITHSAKWVIGRGSSRIDKDKRNVDILLAAPGSTFTKGLLAVHAILRMHSDSGVWMICAASESSDLSEDSSPKAIATLDEHEIFYNGFRCLDKPEARLSILAMEFRVQFALNTYPECKTYRDLRNQKLKEHGVDVPDTSITGIPLESDIRAGNLAVFSSGLGSGAFGSVYEGFDPESGELRVVKVVQVKSEAASRSLEPETEIAKRYPHARGLVRQYGWCTSNGELTLEDIFPYNVYLVQRKGKSFLKHFLPWIPGSQTEKLKLCQDLLHGLNTLHKGGIMHRDITPQNILYFKGDPPEAAFCDFGKVCFSKSAKSTSLAAWRFLPPEIVAGQQNAYNQSIDIWMLAFSLTILWYPLVTAQIPYHSNGQLMRDGLKAIRYRLHAMAKDDGLAQLLFYMLADEPYRRPTPKKALEHPCFRALKAELPQEAESSGGKRPRVDEESIDVEAAQEKALRAE